MALINRFSRLFRADLHAVLDRIEEPDVILRQAVREMEEEILVAERRLKLLQHETSQIETRQTEVSRFIQQAADELAICLDADNDDLARSLLKRKLESERLVQFLHRKQAELNEAGSELKSRLAQNRVRLTAMQQKLELLSAEERRYAGDDEPVMPDFGVRDEDVEIALLRAKQNRRSS